VIRHGSATTCRSSASATEISTVAGESLAVERGRRDESVSARSSWTIACQARRSPGTVEISVADAMRPASRWRCRAGHGAERQGALATVGAISNEHLAVRPGVIYSANGRARFGLLRAIT